MQTYQSMGIETNQPSYCLGSCATTIAITSAMPKCVKISEDDKKLKRTAVLGATRGIAAGYVCGNMCCTIPDVLLAGEPHVMFECGLMKHNPVEYTACKMEQMHRLIPGDNGL